MDSKPILNMTKQQKAHARQRARQIIWFNPPHSKNVTSETAKSFLFLLNKHLPKSNKLHKIVNRNTVKASSGCTENIGSIQQKSGK